MSERLTVAAGDATLAVRIDGDPGLPWLMLSNSLAADMTMWDDQLSDLLRLRRVVRYDTRGRRASSAPPGSWDLGRLAADAVAILDRLAIPTVDYLGLSLGGMTGVGLGLLHPARLGRLICCDTRGDYPAAALTLWDERVRAVSAGGVAAIAEDTLARWFTEQTRRERPALIDRARRMILATSTAGYCGCVAALKALDYGRQLPALVVPTLFVAGEQDMAAPPAAMQAMAAATPGARFAVVPGAAHLANMENALSFNATVCGFLGEGSATSRR